MRRVDPAELSIRPFHLLDREWALLVGGRERPNPMTVSWGGFGTLWNRPAVTVYVRPSRHTYRLLTAHPEFTLNFLPDAYRAALDLCGHRSGRDVDKWSATGLHPLAGTNIAVPRIAEARLAFECRVLTTLDVDPARVPDSIREELYGDQSYHRAFVGEVLDVWSD